MKRRLVISDIHGCKKTLEALLFNEVKVQKDDEVYFLGDFIDRGPDSKGTIDLLIQLDENNYNFHFLRGNHEQLLLDSLYSVPNYDLWHINGSDATLNSFGVFLPNEIPQKYLNFINSLPFYYELPEFILVHGGLNFDIDEPLNDKYSMLWMRNKEIAKNKIQNKRIIVGHTPKPIDDLLSSVKSDRIMIDGGCCYAHKYQKLGKLVAMNIDTYEIMYVNSIDV